MGLNPIPNENKAMKDLEDLEQENRLLRADANKVKILDKIYIQQEMTTCSNPMVPIDNSDFFAHKNNPFRLDGEKIAVHWTKRGLKVGCTIVTREALKALSELE